MESIQSLCSALSACCQLLFVVSLSFSFLARMDAVTVNQTEEVAALLLFRQHNSQYMRQQNSQIAPYTGYWITWNASDDNACTWAGVICTVNYTVQELDVSGLGIIFNTLQPLSTLRDLRRLDLSFNVGLNTLAIDSIGSLTQLTRLDLSGTSHGFRLSSRFFGCKNLRFLVLQQCLWSGKPLNESISSNISDLVNLQFLNLAGNLLTGSFPTEEVGGLSSLLSLDLSGNSLSGSIPSLPNLISLLELKLDGNNFTEFEKDWFLGTNRLQYLSVSNNNIRGKIPSSIANFGTLSLLNMSGNYLSDDIPSGFSTAITHSESSGMSLDLSYNQLTGGIPPDMFTEACSFSLNLSNNLLTGNIPNGSSPVCFYYLSLASNNLSGPIPSNILNSSSVVQFLWLDNNSFSGDIVENLFTFLYLSQEARLGNNNFSGDLSKIVSNRHLNSIVLNRLNVLDLSNNHIQWSVSDAFLDPIQATLRVISTVFPIIVEFRVGGNNFSGTPLPTACIVNTSYNYAQYEDIFSILDLSNSQLEGEISGAAFSNSCLPSLTYLNLSNNHASGSLPQGILADRPLSPNFVVDVSYNNLSGTLPFISQSSNLYNPKYFSNNSGLCGEPLAPCTLSPQQGTGVQWWVLLIAISASVMVAMGSCLAVTWRWRVYHKMHQQDADLIKTLLGRESAALMPLRDLKKATENFAESAQIGEGGFGTVYMGKLNNGTMVAVKRSKHEGSEKDKEQFLNEVRILSQIKHRNLVKLLGCCMENKIAVLVFEFVSNGTLGEHLQGKFGAAGLSWKQRLNIAIQTADALNYLHSTTTLPIYHRDVKSANILLDENLDAKVADFGISKLAPLQATHVSTVAVQGTIGYIDPEYYTSYKLTDKSDVFSFGVVLLELISAKPALDFLRGGDDTSLVYFAAPYIAKGELLGFIDPVLMETYSDQAGHGRESILTVGKLAMKCLELRSRARPTMYEVLKELKKLWVDIEGTSSHTEETDNEDLQLHDSLLLFDIQSEESSSFRIENDASGIQLSQLSRPHSLRSQR